MAQRVRPSQGSGRGGTRKPVTIDLEANAAGKADEVAPKAAETPTTPDTATRLDKGARQGAEPVAMEPGASLRTGGDKTGSEVAETDTSTSAKTDAATTGSADGDGAKKDRVEKPKVEKPERAAAAPPPPAKRGGIGAVAAGLIGGVIALVGGAGLQWVGFLPSPGDQAEMVDLAPVESQIGALQARLDALAAAQPSGEFEIPDALTQQIDTAVQDAQAAQTSIESLDTQINDLRAAISSGQAGEGAGLEALSGRLDAIEQQVGSVSEQMAALSDQSGSVDAAALDEVSAATAALLGDVNDLSARIVAAAQDTDQLRTEVDERVGALEAGLNEARQQLAEGGADSTIVARAIAAAGLKSAIDRGSSFMTELEAYATVAGEDETVTSLRDFAASGVPTVTQLAEGFGAVANRIVATGQGLDENASIGDRLLSSARGLVQVRPVGEVEGDTPGAIAARIETRLKAGNLDAARAEWDALPEAAQAASSDFMDQVQARQTVDQLVAGALSTAMSAAQPAASQ